MAKPQSVFLTAVVAMVLGIAIGAVGLLVVAGQLSPGARDVANQLEKAYRALGMEYMRDTKILRSGEEWLPTLFESIEQAEVFQLLWSRAAKRSSSVSREWQHAMGLGRRFFIRPVYWERPMPAPPKELADIHFVYLELGNQRVL